MDTKLFLEQVFKNSYIILFYLFAPIYVILFIVIIFKFLFNFIQKYRLSKLGISDIDNLDG
ncbi:MAG: hypothetical protein ACP5RD_03275, partial [bacterium]